MSEHTHHHEPETSKYEQALKKYDLNLSDEAVKEAVAKIIAEKVPENDTTEVKRFLMGSVELTSLSTTDSEESILRFTERVNAFEDTYPDLPHVATICVYPCFAQIVSQSLEVEGVEVACVSGSFPSSQALIEVKVAETALAIKDGATEIDIVMSVGKFLSGDYETLCDEISELKAACGDHKNESHPRNGLSEDCREHQESFPVGHVCRSRLYQNVHRETRTGRYAGSRLCHVPSHQGIL